MGAYPNSRREHRRNTRINVHDQWHWPFGIKDIKWTDTTGTVRSGVDVLQDRSTSPKQFSLVQVGVAQSNEEAEITDL